MSPRSSKVTSTSFTLAPKGSFGLEMIRTFQCGCFSASRRCTVNPDEVEMAFPLDGTFEVVGVRLRRRGAILEGEAVGTVDVDAIRRQVARVLSVDHDGHGFDRLLERDPVLGKAARRHPGFRPPLFHSPYVAAGWLVLTQRLRQTQAAAIQRAIAEAGGDLVELSGERLASFPRPETLLRWSRFPGVSGPKWARLQSVARAALEGKLDIDRLRSLPYAEAHASLTELHGIGPWTADGILMRGSGLADALPLAEPRVHQAVALAYGLDRTPTDDELVALTERWRPYRAWATVLLVLHHGQNIREQDLPPRSPARSVKRRAA